MQDARGEMKATYDLGNAYQQMKDYIKAAEYQEQHLKLAQEHSSGGGEGAEDARQQVDVAYHQLKRTYTECVAWRGVA